MYTAILDVAIGVTFLYLMVSLLVTIVQEGVASFCGLRAQNLFEAIENLLEDPKLEAHAEYADLVKDFYKHPLIQSLYRHRYAPGAGKLGFWQKVRLPSYIPSRTFAIALLDVLREKKQASDVLGINKLLDDASGLVSSLPAGKLRRALGLLVADADSLGNDLDARAHGVSARIEGWFNDSMARASGWYKRKAQVISIAIGLVLAGALNADTFHVAALLWTNNTLRAEVSTAAQSYYDDHKGQAQPDPTLVAQWNRAAKALDSSMLPIGWTSVPAAARAASDANAPSVLAFDQRESWLVRIAGWVVTGLATSLGAAFWFDVLGKALQIRGSGVRIPPAGEDPSAKKKIESSSDAPPATVAPPSVAPITLQARIAPPSAEPGA